MRLARMTYPTRLRTLEKIVKLFDEIEGRVRFNRQQRAGLFQSTHSPLTLASRVLGQLHG